ncbi:hypothetical protein V8E36_005512 [Tilletia maclaganii]
MSTPDSIPHDDPAAEDANAADEGEVMDETSDGGEWSDEDGSMHDEDSEGEEGNDADAFDKIRNAAGSKPTPKIRELLNELKEFLSEGPLYLSRGLDLLRRVRGVPGLTKNIQAKVDLISEDALRFLCILTKHDQIPGNRPLPGSAGHLILASALQYLEDMAERAEWFAEQSTLERGRQRASVLGDLDVEHKSMRQRVQLYKDRMGIADNKQRMLAGKVARRSETEPLTSDDKMLSIFRETVHRAWDHLNWNDNEIPDFFQARRAFEHLSGIDFSNDGNVTDFPFEQIVFADEEAARLWHSEGGPLGTALLEGVEDDLEDGWEGPHVPHGPLGLCHFIAWLWRACRPHHSDLALVCLAAVARQKLAVDPKAHYARLWLGKILCALTQLHSADGVSGGPEMGQEAVKVLRPLYEADPERYRHPMAAALLQFSQSNEPGDDFQRYIDAAREAIELYGQLYATEHTNVRYQDGLASAHKMLGDCLSDEKQAEASVDSYRISIGHFRELVKRYPSMYKFHLSDLLALYSKQLTELGETPEDPTEISDEGLALIESEKERWPIETSQNLIHFNIFRATTYSDDADYENALVAANKAHEAVLRYAELIRQPDPERLALVLVIRSSIFVGMERHQDGLVDANAAAVFYQSPDLNTEHQEGLLGAALNCVGFCEWMLGRHRVAFKTTQRAVKIARKVSAEGSLDDHEDLCGALAQLGALHCILGSPHEALVLGTEAVDLARADAQAAGDGTGGNSAHMLAWTLTLLAGTHLSAGEHHLALRETETAVALMKEFDTVAYKLKTAVRLRARVMDTLGRTEEAEAVRKEMEVHSVKGCAEVLGVRI